MWSFFGSGHGKGPHDGAGAVVKRYICTAQLDAMGPELANAEQVVNLLREKLSSRPETSYTSINKSDVFRYFWHVTKAALETERKTPYMCMRIAGTRDLHQIRSVGAMETNRLLTRSLACFCFSCLECKWDECENLVWTRGWKVETLIPENQAHVREAIAQTYDGEHWTDFGADREHLASSLELGQNFATNTAEDNEAGVDFEVLMCTKVAYIVKKGFAYDWGQEFEVGDLCIGGLYYQQYGTDERNYVLLRNSKIAHLHAWQVRAIKFPMEPQDYKVSGNDVVYRLGSHGETGIRNALASFS